MQTLKQFMEAATPEVKAKSEPGERYLLDLAGSTGARVGRWDISPFVGPDGALFSAPRDVNPLFFAKLEGLAKGAEKVTEMPAELTRSIGAAIDQAAQRAIQDIGYTLQDRRNSLQQVTMQLRQCVAALRDAEDLADSLASSERMLERRSRLLNELGEIAKTGLWSLPRVSTNGRLLFLQTQKTVLEGRDLGRYVAEIPVMSANAAGLIITAGIGCRRANGCFHPHVGNNTICWGDESLSAAAAEGEGRLCDLLVMVHEVLHSFNPKSPYTPIEAWDRNTEALPKHAGFREAT